MQSTMPHSKHLFAQNVLPGLEFKWIKLTFMIICPILLFLCASGKGLYARPQSSLLFELFLKEGLLPLIIASFFMFIVLVRIRPDRLEEIRFLNSLPFSHPRTADYFLEKEAARYAWMPAVPILILWTLSTAAPAAYICRISFVLLLWYALIFSIFVSVVIAFPSSKYNALMKYNPLFAFLAVIFFAAGVPPIILIEDFFSGFSFWLVFSVCVGAVYVMRHLFRIIFSAWIIKNSLFRAGSSTVVKTGGLFTSSFMINKISVPPLFGKNVLKLTRENSLLVTGLTILYILLGYLASRNNQRLDDFLSILLTVTVMYSIFFSLKIQSFFAESGESRKIIHTLPLKKSEFFLSVYVPAAIWIVLVTTVFSLLAVASRAGLSAGLFFWLRGSFLSMVFITAALNYAFAAYPDEKKGQTHFVIWGLLLLVFIALFYKYRYLVLLLMLCLSFITMLRLHLYRKY